MAVPTDISSQADVEKLLEAVTSSYQSLDLLICNAGTARNSIVPPGALGVACRRCGLKLVVAT
jgi:NADP-dependent 3-hydroxy acid dehydrogenase YdfG